MVLAHARFSTYGSDFINMFHMPLFFFFSGYCFKEKYLDCWKDYIGKKIKGVYFPYVKWGLLFLLFHNIFFNLNIYNDEYGFQGEVSHIYTLQEYMMRAVHIITCISDHEQLLGGYWFLHALFWGAILFYIIIKFVRNRFMRAGILLCCCLASLYWNVKVPYFGIGGKELLAGFFILVGAEYKQLEYSIEKKWYIIPIGMLLVIIGTEYWQCSMLSLTWQKLLPYTISALVGTIMVFSISKLLLKLDKVSKIMVYIGDHTLSILTWHFLSFKLVSILLIVIYNLPNSRLAEFPVIEEYAWKGWWIAYLFVGVTFPLMIKSGYYGLKELMCKR